MCWLRKERLYTYDVYGLMRPSGTGDRDPLFAFPGRPLAVYQPETGESQPIYDFRARHYDPILGRFMQHDPAEYADSFNLYLALGGNPLVWMDPTGESLLDLLYSVALRAKLAAVSVASGAFGIIGRIAGILNDRAVYIEEALAESATAEEAVKAEEAVQNTFAELSGTLGRVNVPDIGRKLNYIFGNLVPGSPKHSLDRAAGLLQELLQIGIRDTVEWRLYIADLWIKAGLDKSNIVKQVGDKIWRETLVVGPQGFLRMVTEWRGSILETVYLLHADSENPF